MNKFLIALLSLSSSVGYSASVDYNPHLGREMDRVRVYKPTKSNWVATFGFDAVGMNVPHSFQGQKKQFSDRDELLAGGRLGFGRDFYLGKGFTTRTNLEGSFVGTLFEPKKKVTDEDSKAANSFSQKQGHIWSGEVSQTLSFIREFSAPAFMSDDRVKMYYEPFIEAGLGYGSTFYKFKYKMDTTSVKEEYTNVLNNKFLSQRISLGINFITTSGYFLTIKGSKVAHHISSSDSYEVGGTGGSVTRRTIDQKNDKVDLAYSYFVGGGYKW